MRQELAELVLAKVMQWDVEAFSKEFPGLSRMSLLKYDEYQQYRPGQKFIESLSLWLRQFKTPDERQIAYQWIKARLVFISNQEMRQLVEAAYPDFVRPILLEIAAKRLGCESHHVAKISGSREFAGVRRRSLFLGLSDGSRMDVFRRAAELNNEQVWQAYEIGDPKAKKFLKDLRKDEGPEAKFESVFLVDDFTASGTSYFRKEDGELTGKIHKAVSQLREQTDLVAPECSYFILLYVATDRAMEYLERELNLHYTAAGVVPPRPLAVCRISSDSAVSPANELDTEFLKMVDGEDYYRKREMDEHELKGGTDDVKRGYAGCGLPVVLVHNTPNNSLYLLWANETDSVKGLFPRVTRHKEV